MKRVILSLLLLAVMCLPAQTASSQTVLIDVWKEKEHRGVLKKISVFWIIKAQQHRVLAESEFVRRLKERGVVAMPATVVIPPDAFVERDVAIAKLKSLDMDAVLILRLTDKQTGQSPITRPGPARLSEYYQYIHDAPVRDESELAYLETNLFEVKSERRIWTARSVTKVSVVDQKALAEFIGILIDRLAADGMIP